LKGKRPKPTLVWHADPKPVGKTTKVTTPHIARTIKQLMIGVVREGTGTQAAIPCVTVAGKTGTAELASTDPCQPGETSVRRRPSPASARSTPATRR
jgi:cell division protein FtsI/penicillin-binding protein 2